jgi:RHS repeat-associated protein
MSNNLVQRLSKLLSTVALVSAAQTAYAQVYQPTAYPANTQVSFVRTWDAVAPEQDPNALISRPVKDVKQATQYLDGLGRPIQTVIKQGSLVSGGAPTDVVSTNVYDEFGREQYKFLPTVANNTGGNASINDGAFKLNPFQQQEAFYNSSNTNSPIKGQNETFFYSQTNFESSPLNRPTKSFAQGNSWVGTRGSSTVPERGVAQQYLINTANDNVKIFNIVSTSGILPTSTGSYNAGELFKTVVTDEHGKQVVEFKDKEGKVVLKKVQIAPAVTDGHTGWLCTYYVYDDFNQLRFVLSPKATEAYLSGTSLATIADELCFKNEYDERGRKIKSKVPGAAEVCIVYDARDRVVLTQDGNLLAQGKWLYTQYDDLNRPIATGLWASALTQAQHASNAANSITYPTMSGEEELSRTFYDNYNWVSTYGNPLSNAYNTTYNSYFTTPSNTAWPYAQANTQSTQIKGMPTGSRIKVLGTSTYLYTIPFYDDKGRVIQVQSTNNTGGIDIGTTQYTWAGQPLVAIQKQEKGGTNTQTHIVVNKMQYDDLGRVLNVKKVVNSTITTGASTVTINKPEQLIVQHEYDALGQLKTKKLGANNLETLNYDYNIRGWMLGINKDYIKEISTNYFAMELAYDKITSAATGTSFAASQFNGNINGLLWKSKGDGVNRQYDFEYDNANRLLNAAFKQKNSNNSWNNTEMDYTVKMGNGIDYTKAYDANGNILQMQQWGWKMGGSVQIDNLKYTYNANSNKLKSVTDFNNDVVTKLGDFKTNTTHPQNATKAALTPSSSPSQFDAITDYTYDINGNLILDNNKAIGSIGYNFLNLPSNTTVTGKGSITYTYDAAGNKLKKVSVENPSATNGNKTITTTTNYVSGIIYESKTTLPANTPNDDYTDRLQFMGHEEGRIRLNYTGSTPTAFNYDYYIKDHLNSTRIVLTEEVQQDIYPAATLENVTYNGGTAVSVESQYYTIDNTKIVTQATASGIPVYQNNNGITNNNPYSNTAANSARLYRLDATTNTVPNKTGLGIVLKVMAGDNINVFGKSYHKKPSAGYTNPTNPLNLADVIGLFTGTSLITGKGISATQITSQSGFPTNVTTLLNNQPPQNTDMPRASINWIVFDEQFKYVTGGFDMVGTATNTTGTFKNHTPAAIVIPKNGYIYIYCSNESKYPVFFDNVQVTHNRGAVLEENSYYSHGLIISGISSRAAGKLENKKSKFNGYEYNTDFDINLYESFYRSHDPQLGRFWQLDPKPNDMESLYSAMGNNPINSTDILGDTTKYFNMDGKELGTINNSGSLTRVKVNETLYNTYQEGWNKAGLGLDDQKMANTYVAFLNGTLYNLEATGKYGDLISFETGRYQLDFTGSTIGAKDMTGKNLNLKKNAASGITGTMYLNSIFDNGSTLTVNSYPFTSGPYANGPTPNNNYVASVFIARAAHPDDKGLFLAGKNYGWKLRLPDFNGRDGMLIHPDCNQIGTKGCIGIRTDNSTLIQLGNFFNNYINVQRKTLNVNFQIPGNPNYGNEGKLNNNLKQ